MTSKRRGRRSGSGGRGGSRTILIVAAAVVVAAAAIALVAGNGGHKTKTASNVAETRPVTVTGTPLPPFPASGKDPARGQAAPELRGQTFDGQAFTVTADGEPKVILMVAHWCPHCQREVPLLAQDFQANGLPQGVQLVTVATDTNPNSSNYPPSAWLSRVGWPVPALADDGRFTAAAAYGLSAFPFFCAVDAQNKVVLRVTGELSIAQFNQVVNAARTGTPPPGSA
jgi:thiol-disulfide isomerase/thioredoxin